MPLIGSHLSIAGGYYKAVRKAAELELDCVQLFTKNNNQWKAKPISEEDISLFKTALDETGIKLPISHDSYLINLASADDELWNKSIEAMVIELERAAMLGIDNVVAHPGSHLGAGEEAGLARIAAALDIVFDRTAALSTCIALETTAGQGTNLGAAFEHLQSLIEQCSFADRLTACMDTCHVFAAGYPLAPKKQYMETMKHFDQCVGFDRLVAVHVNDSKKGLGSRVDRHEHIGRGCLGIEPFELLMNDRRFAKIPLYLETFKGTDEETGEDWDLINARALRSLVKKK